HRLPPDAMRWYSILSRVVLPALASADSRVIFPGARMPFQTQVSGAAMRCSWLIGTGFQMVPPPWGAWREEPFSPGPGGAAWGRGTDRAAVWGSMKPVSPFALAASSTLCRSSFSDHGGLHFGL